MGVDHHHVGRGGAGSGRLGEAVLAAGAVGGAGALAWSHRDGAPGRNGGIALQFGLVAHAGGLGPFDQPGQLGLGIVRTIVEFEGALRQLLGHLVHPLKAGIVGPALQHGEAHLAVEGGGQKRQVHLGQLVLERLGGGRHHRAPARQHRRHQVRQRLSCTGARLHHQVAFVGDGLGHRLGHRHLARPFLAATGQRPGDRRQRAHHGIGRRRGAVGGGVRRSHGSPSYPAWMEGLRAIPTLRRESYTRTIWARRLCASRSVARSSGSLVST